MSKPTTLQGRVIVLDPYDEAVWVNIAVFGGNAESGLFWQKIHPGKNVKFYADKGAWEELKKMGRVHEGDFPFRSRRGRRERGRLFGSIVECLIRANSAADSGPVAVNRILLL